MFLSLHFIWAPNWPMKWRNRSISSSTNGWTVDELMIETIPTNCQWISWSIHWTQFVVFVSFISCGSQDHDTRNNIRNKSKKRIQQTIRFNEMNESNLRFVLLFFPIDSWPTVDSAEFVGQEPVDGNKSLDKKKTTDGNYFRNRNPSVYCLLFSSRIYLCCSLGSWAPAIKAQTLVPKKLLMNNTLASKRLSRWPTFSFLSYFFSHSSWVK